MFGPRSHSRALLATLFALVGLVSTAHPLAAQASVTDFIATVEEAISTLTASLPPVTKPLVFSAQETAAYGSKIAGADPKVLIDYADGLKAVGVQRIDFNPGVTTMNDPTSVANLDVLVRHIRQLGLQLAINPEYLNGEITVNTLQDFQNAAVMTYPLLAARYQPDNFVIVHEPTTMAGRMGITTTPAEWDGFIRTLEPLIKAASPHTRVGAGDCSICNEQAFFTDFVAIPTCNAANLGSGCLDFMTMDLYTTDFSQDETFAQMAHANGKGVYMEETFAPHYLQADLPAGYQYGPGGAEAYALIGACDSVFETMDQNWLAAMTQFDSAYGMEAITPFTTQTFFLYVNGTPDKPTDPAYVQAMTAAVKQGQLTATGTAYRAAAQQFGIKTATSISNASYATLPTVFNPSCGTADNPCNPNSTAAPDMIVSAFGVDLANQTIPANPSWPTSLGGTTVTLVDSTTASLPVQIYSVSPDQVNYLIPSKTASGPATLTITSGSGTVTTGIVLVAPVAPGLYTSFANGKGPAAAIAVCTGTCSGWPNPLGNGQFYQYTFTPGCASGPCTVPLSWGAGDSVVIELYGTGIRHLTALSDITAAIGSKSLQVQYAGKQGTDTGLDQVNVAIPQSLRGAGQVSLTLTVQDTVNSVADMSNAVALDLH